MSRPWPETLVELPIDGDPENTRWVVYVGDARYAIGHFDGKTFTPEHEGKYQVHYGPHYASQTFSGTPDGRVYITSGRGRSNVLRILVAVSMTTLYVRSSCLAVELPPELPLWEKKSPDRQIRHEVEEQVRSYKAQPGSPSGLNRAFSSVASPTYSIHRPENPNGVGLVICPGGGFHDIWIDREGHDLAICPMFIVNARDDELTPAQECVNFCASLLKAGANDECGRCSAW